MHNSTRGAQKLLAVSEHWNLLGFLAINFVFSDYKSIFGWALIGLWWYNCYMSVGFVLENKVSSYSNEYYDKTKQQQLPNICN